MRYTIRFQLVKGGQVLKVAWEDGMLKGNPVVVKLVKGFTEFWRDKPYKLSPTGPTFKGDPVENGLAFLVMCQEEFYGVRAFGAVPLFPKQEGII